MESIIPLKICEIEGLSAHADQKGSQWLSELENKPKKVFLVHGETNLQMNFAKIREHYGFDCSVL
jgi:metallo-beta-lactamase family protein